MTDPKLEYQSLPRYLPRVNAIMAIAYLSWWVLPGNAGFLPLYLLLFSGELYHVFMAVTFWQTIASDFSFRLPDPDAGFQPSVDIFITVAGEPVSIVRDTVRAAQAIDYQRKRVYILNDGFIAGKPDWPDIEQMGQELGVRVITRKSGGGAKAGNINHALRLTDADFIAVFDADMQPYPEFLQSVMSYFRDNHIAFVQTPQYYRNHTVNDVAAAAWEQQRFFYGPILMGKQQHNAVFICGTNVVIRRSALESVGGLSEDNIAEDFFTSLTIHSQGWKSVYVPRILSSGLGPEDLRSYYRQQLRWARGSLEVVFRHNPFLKPGLTFRQKIEYLSSAMFYLNGVIVAIDLIVPLLFLYTGIVPVSTSTVTFAVFFIPFMFLNMYTLYRVSRGTLTFRALSLAHAAFPLQIRAVVSVLAGQALAFAVTPKTAQQVNTTYLAFPHLAYAVLSVLGVIVAITRDGLSPSVSTNAVWALFNVVLFLPYIRLAVQPGAGESRMLPQPAQTPVPHAAGSL